MEYFNLIAVKGQLTQDGWLSKRQDGTTVVNLLVQVSEGEKNPLILDVMIINDEIVKYLMHNTYEIGKDNWIGIKGELKKVKTRYVNEIKIDYRIIVENNAQHKFVVIKEDE